MPTDPDTLGWTRGAVLVEPAVAATSTASGAALSVLLTGVEVSLQTRTAPLVGARTAAFVAALRLPPTGPEHVVVRHTLRGFAAAEGGATVGVVVAAGGRTTVCAIAPDDGGGWTAELDVPLPSTYRAAYPVAITIVGTRPSPDALAYGGVESIEVVLHDLHDGAERAS